MSKVYILEGKRTAIGNFQGTLSRESLSKIGAEVLKDVIKNTGVDVKKIDEVVIGNVLSGGLGQGIARQISLEAGVGIEIPAYGVNLICGSGMKSIINGYTAIKSGEANLIVAGGVELMSSAPFLLSGKVRSGNGLGNIVSEDHILKDALTDGMDGYHMGITAENIATKFNITRDQQDEFALESQKRAVNAIKDGKFKDEITAIKIKTRKGEIVFNEDEYPKKDATIEGLNKLRSAFKKDGTVTAGNASGINDGASMILLSSEKEKCCEPLGEIVSVGQGGVEPSLMGLGPVVAVRNALKKAGMKLEDMELIELNEAFASQSLGVIKMLSEEHDVTEEWIKEKTNVNGGAIALGHPVGVSGNRIVITLLNEMKKRNLKYGIASLCIGGGMGTAIIVKR